MTVASSITYAFLFFDGAPDDRNPTRLHRPMMLQTPISAFEAILASGETSRTGLNPEPETPPICT